MANINANPTHKANLPKHGFDVGKTLKFTSSVGQLLPVYWDLANPGDKYRFSTEMLTRTREMVSPAFVRLTEHVDWFFVPLEQLDHFFKDTYYGIKDNGVSFVSDTTPTNIPCFDLLKVRSLFSSTYLAPTYNDLPTGAKDFFGIPLIYNCQRLLELLGYSSGILFAGSDYTPSDTNKFLVNPYSLGAYQKIYYDHYRLTNRESNNNKAYNFDVYVSGSTIQAFTLTYDQVEMHYRPWKMDYMVNFQPSPLASAGQPSMMPWVSSQLSIMKPSQGYQQESSAFNNPNSRDVTQASSIPQTLASKTSVGINGTTPAQAGKLGTSVPDTSALRTVFAMEKLAEITRRSGKHYDAQTLAHFGYDVPVGISGEVYRLGSESGIIQVGEVIGTATTDESYLGELAGKAYHYSVGKPKEFTCPCHGIVMAITSVVPEADYPAYGLDRLNCFYHPADFYYPEFDRLGMQPFFKYQNQFWPETNDTSDNYHTLDLYGWSYRYLEYKQKYDSVCGAFLTDSSLKSWSPFKFNYSPVSGQPTLQWFVINPNYLDPCMLVAFKPASSDPISKKSCFARDPFVHMFKFNVFKSSVMSTYGLPSL